MLTRTLGVGAACALGLAAAGCGEAGGHGPAAAVGARTAPAGATPAPNGAGSATAVPADLQHDPAYAKFYQQKPAWHACAGSFQCATLTVPLDYANPDGKQLQLGLVKAPATADAGGGAGSGGGPATSAPSTTGPGAGPGGGSTPAPSAKRIGSLLVNPGGPGADALNFTAALVGSMSPQMRAAYDVIGFSPRGTKHSSDPIVCAADPDRDRFYYDQDLTPTDTGQQEQLANANASYLTGCVRREGTQLPFIGTRNVSRDMDVLRGVVGDQKLNYLGYSYGTELGAEYATMFPRNTGRLVLDGPVDPTTPYSSPDSQIVQAAGFQTAWNSFVAACTSLSGCVYEGMDANQANATLNALLSGLGSKPLQVGDRKLTQQAGETGVLEALYSKTSWPMLSEALQSAEAGDGSMLLRLADNYTERESNGSYAGNLGDANLAISCTDNPASETADEVARLLPEFEQASPQFGEYMAWSSFGCPGWPEVPSADKLIPANALGAAPALVIGTTRDPATPYVDAQRMANALSNSVLLTHEGDGHAVYIIDQDGCVDDLVDNFFLTGQLPAKGTVCK